MIREKLIMSTTLDINVYTLKEERWSSGEQVVDAVEQLASQQSKCATVHTGGGMFHKLVCTSAEAVCTWFVNIALTRKGGIGDLHVGKCELGTYQLSYKSQNQPKTS